jgi:hypothetical protein
MIPKEIRYVAVETISHDEQLYDTCGDYWLETVDNEPTFLAVRVSDMGDWRFGFACAIHEQIEAALQVAKGKKDRSTEFDKLYEAARPQEFMVDPKAWYELNATFGCDCRITADSEPGEDKHAPYHDEHMFADGIERLVLRELGADWGDYCAAVEKLDYYQPKEGHDAT